MTKYIIINLAKDNNPERKLFPRKEEDVIFNIKDGKERTLFICDNCFQTFSYRNLKHLEKCRLEWPYKECFLCKFILNQQLRVYRIEKEVGLNKQIIKTIARLGVFSKDEQKIDFLISTQGLLGKMNFGFLKTFRYYYYILFYYKKIIAYSLIQEYTSIFSKVKNIIIRDIYTLPIYRNRGYAKLLLLEIARHHNKKIEDLIFSRDISEDLKLLLKSFGLTSYKSLFGERFYSMAEETL